MGCGSPSGIKMRTLMMRVAVVMTMLLGGAMAQQSGCTSQLVGLAPCLGYITGIVTVPSSPCCRQLNSIVQTQPQCLCQLVGSASSSPLGIAINQAQALSLPGACNLQTPDVSLCKLLNQPSGTGTGTGTGTGSGSGSGSGSGATGGSTVGNPTTSPTGDGSTPDSSQTPQVPQTTPSTNSGLTPADLGFGSTSLNSGNVAKFSLHLTIFLLFIASSVSTIIRVV